MTECHAHQPETGPFQGRTVRPASPAELAEAVEQAFDYRGDVTLELRSGEKVEGYVFNRSVAGSPPTVQLFPKAQPGVRTIPYVDIVSIAFTGEDSANGKSWEAWIAKKESQRRTEAEQAAARAKARGHL